MNPPAIGPGFGLVCSHVFRFPKHKVVRVPETLVAACTKVIWEGDKRVQEGGSGAQF